MAWLISSSSTSIITKLKTPDSLMIRVLWQLWFTLVLLVVWLAALWLYSQTLPPRGPRDYPTTLTPGLSFRPRPEDPKSTLIHFQHGGSGNWMPLFKRFKLFLKENTREFGTYRSVTTTPLLFNPIKDVEFRERRQSTSRTTRHAPRPSTLACSMASRA